MKRTCHCARKESDNRLPDRTGFLAQLHVKPLSSHGARTYPIADLKAHNNVPTLEIQSMLDRGFTVRYLRDLCDGLNPGGLVRSDTSDSGREIESVV